MRTAFFKKIGKERRAQMTIEYSVMFVAIVAVILYAASEFVKPALNRYFNSTARIINNASSEIENSYSG